MMAVFALSAVAASTASAKRVWTVCKEVPGVGTEPPVKFDNSECNTKVKPVAERKWEDVILPAGETRSLKIVNSVVNAELRVPGAAETILCKNLAINAGNTIGNVSVEGNLTGRDLLISTFTGCTNSKKPLCTTVTVPPFTTPTFLNENTAKTKIYDEFRPAGATELTPKEITEKGTAASKAIEETLKPYVNIEQSGEGCTAVAVTKAEGNGVAAEISPETMSVKKKLIFPCPPIKEETLWNGLTIGFKLKAFGFAAEECIPAIEVELTTKGGWDVQ
jgi:hypothetical protein